MRWTFAGHLSPIGLDLGTHSMKAVQLVERGDRWQATAAVCLERTDPNVPLGRPDLLRLLDVLQRQGFVGRKAAVALEGAKMMESILELPARAPGLPLGQIAQAEFCQLNKVDADQVVMSWWDLPASSRAARASYAMAVGYRTIDADALLDLLEGTGIEIEALDACGSAPVRACRKLLASPSTLTAIADIGWTATTISVATSGVICYQRRIADCSLASLVRAIATDCGISQGDAELVMQRTGLSEDTRENPDELQATCRSRAVSHFARATSELQQAFEYGEREYGNADQAQMLLAGGGAALPGLDTFLQDVLHLPVKVVDAFDVVECPASLEPILSSSMLGAVGLAQFKVAEAQQP